MRLIAIRHGIAADPPEHGGPDATRPLTERGRERCAAAARGLLRLEAAPALILTSPLVRAAETAAILAGVLGTAAPVRTAALAPGGDPGRVLDEARATGADTVIAVGHRPDLDALIAHALDLGQPVTRLGKCGAAAVAFEDGGAELLWVLTPRALRALGGSD